MLQLQATSVAQEHKKSILFSWYIETVEQNIVEYSGKDE
jgi:hypothetical protein